MLLQTRPDLALIAVFGLLVVVIFLVKMAEDVQQQAQTGSMPRRSFMESFLAVVVTIFLLAYTLPSSISTFSEESCWLTIEENQTYTVSSGESEEYCGIRCDGQLNINGYVELSGTT